MDRLYLIFAHHGVRYALHAGFVQEIVWLPELSPVADGSLNVVGAFNLRGHVVPVLDLGVCLGRGRSQLRVSDAVIVITIDGERVGVLAGEVLDATPIALGAVEDVQVRHELLGNAANLLDGVAMRDEELAMILDVRALLAGAAARAPCGEAPKNANGVQSVGANLPEHEAEILRSRAHALAQQQEGAASAIHERFALFRLDAELFGIPVRVVREFMAVRSIWPVPCCPEHILGNMNVRGDILTLVDLRPVLGLPVPSSLTEVAVVHDGDLTIGVAVTEVIDIVDAGDIAMQMVHGDDRELPFCRGTARFGERIFSIIDIESMLSSRVLHVTEAFT